MLIEETAQTVRLRVLIVEDDSFTRIAMREMTENLGFQVMKVLGTSAETLEFLQNNTPHVCIFDLDLGEGPSGLDLAHVVKRRFPNMGIVILSSHRDPRLVHVSKDNAPAGTVYLIKGEMVNSQILSKAILAAFEHQRKTKKELSQEEQIALPKISLTNSQIQLMKLIALGKSNIEIARLHQINLKSVENAISRLAKRLRIANEPETNQRVLITRHFVSLTGKHR
ncbi:MAG: response regulator transcription factor [Actinomycetes bacterium]